MNTLKKIKVLVIDDSLLFRGMLVKILSSDPQIEVVAVAADPFEAREKIINTVPDVITCDVEMPKMNGIDFIRWLLPRQFFPVIMISTVNNVVFEAMSAGAVDFVAKPAGQLMDNQRFAVDLIQKIKAAATVKSPPARLKASSVRISGNMLSNTEKIIAIGASTGGTEAIFSILKVLPTTIAGIVIVQHIPPVFSRMFAERMDAHTKLSVKEAENTDYIEPGKVLIAPGDRHLKIRKIGKRYKAECVQGEKVSGHCPSVDVLFDSVAKEAGSSAIGILLTGMGHDGAKGLLSIREKGGRTIGQDEASSVVYGMPKAGFDIGGVEIQASLENIPQTLINLLG